jgi:hypothetical protein
MTTYTKHAYALKILNEDNQISELTFVNMMLTAGDQLKSSPFTEEQAKAYFRGCSKELGLTVAKAPRARTAKAKTVKVSPQKFPKVLLTNKPKVTDKTVEELADIKAKNLARLKAVGAKYQKGKSAEARYSDEPFDSSAVPNLENELDSFKAPAFLTKDQVNALV